MNSPSTPEVRYTLLQQSLDIPPADGLRRAFESVRTLTSADAPAVARDAFGILVKSLSLNDATTLKQALEAEGIGTELIPDKLLPQLPVTKFVRQFDFGEDALLLHDPLGRRVPLEYQHLTILAAGEVELTTLQNTSYRMSDSPPRFLGTSALRLELEDLDRPRQARAQMARTRKHFLELIVGRGAARFTIEADTNAHLLFRVLGDRCTDDFTQNLALILRDLSEASPKAILNRGAYALRTDPPSTFNYPTRNTFHEELTWILWHSNKGDLRE